MSSIEQHSLPRSIMLHLFPGVLIAVFYFLTVQPVQTLGFPSYMALLLAIPVVLLPVQLGYLFYQGKKRNSRFSLRGIVLYRERIPMWQYFVFVPVLFLVLAALFKLTSPVDNILLSSFFSWIPVSVVPVIDPTAHTRPIVIITYLTLIVFAALVAPIVEEMYFRGFLLPRISRFKKWAPAINSGLFAMYHLWTPWRVISRAIFFFPVVYVVQHKKNIYLGMAVHIMANSVDAVLGVLFLLSLV